MQILYNMRIIKSLPLSVLVLGIKYKGVQWARSSVACAAADSRLRFFASGIHKLVDERRDKCLNNGRPMLKK